MCSCYVLSDCAYTNCMCVYRLHIVCVYTQSSRMTCSTTSTTVTTPTTHHAHGPLLRKPSLWWHPHGCHLWWLWDHAHGGVCTIDRDHGHAAIGLDGHHPVRGPHPRLHGHRHARLHHHHVLWDHARGSHAGPSHPRWWHPGGSHAGPSHPRRRHARLHGHHAMRGCHTRLHGHHTGWAHAWLHGGHAGLHWHHAMGCHPGGSHAWLHTGWALHARGAHWHHTRRHAHGLHWLSIAWCWHHAHPLWCLYVCGGVVYATCQHECQHERQELYSQ